TLLTGYRQVLGNEQFMLWAITFALMFAGFFIYVLSAPVFLIRHLGLEETDFIWLFGPATAGMMTGSYFSGRFAQRWSTSHCLITGFTIRGLASLWNLAICYWGPEAYGWYLPYLFIYTLGMALVQPTIVLAGLDCVPERRGLGASLQLFIQTGFNAVLAAVIAPLFWHTPLLLASGAALAMVLAAVGVALSWILAGRTGAASPARDPLNPLRAGTTVDHMLLRPICSNTLRTATSEGVWLLKPPSATKVVPVTNADSSDARKATTSAICLGVPSSGVQWLSRMISSRASGSGCCGARPICTALPRMPCLPYCAATSFGSINSAALEVA